jgi:malate dehydrogenase (oxaloacetate-decarboxylating)(NADP+)
METGAARVEIDLDEYRDHLMASLGPGREVMRFLTTRARRRPPRVVLADGQNDKVIRAAAQIVDEGVARPVLLGKPHKIEPRAKVLGVDLGGIEIVHPALEDETRYRYAGELHAQRRRKGLTLAEARSDMYKPIHYGAMMLRQGDADALVAGVESNYPEVLRPALEIVGTAPGVVKVAGLYMVALRNRDPSSSPTRR